MLSTRMIKYYGVIISLLKYSGVSVYTWDKEHSELVLTHYQFLMWNWNMVLSFGYSMSGFMVFHIFLKVLSNEIEEGSDLTSFAILVFTLGELLLIMTSNLLTSRIRKMKREIMYLTNQLFKHHNQLTVWLKARNIVLDRKHQEHVRGGEKLVISFGYISYIFPLFMLLTMLHRLEPTHNILHEWLELDISLEIIQLAQIAFVPLLFSSIQALGNTITTMLIVQFFYIQQATPALEDIMSPIEISLSRGFRRNSFRTKFYGELEDDEIILRYRTQQMFNILSNKIAASFAVSLHQVTCLVGFAIFAFVAIRFQNVFEEAGFVAFVVVFGTMGCALALQYIEAAILGELADTSDTFKLKANNVSKRGTLMNVFSRSCRRIYVESAYPYFKVDRNTFIQFLDEVADKTITLLLW